ncbi:MAG TPA: rhomboid family intramembrane serine protease [Kiritimatiellia bacterium]|nr:rhomboid family intramembrane serine protease [Kiritimatiellia bacterium]
MRSIGEVGDEKQARLFSDYLYAQGIENEVEAGKAGAWEVWVVDDDQLGEAEGLLGRFREQPDDPVIALTAADAEELRRKAEKEERAAAKLNRSSGDVFRRPGLGGMGTLSLVMIGLSVVVAVMSSMGTKPEAISFLFITTPLVEIGRIRWMPGLPEIMSGEVWRLITPIFIHFGPIHLLFNMLWLKDLGSAIEGRYGWRYLLVFTLVTAALSNVGQYMVSNPLFGGMSGVVYGLLGFVWIRGRVDPWAGIALHSSTVVMMMVWFVLCLTGLMGNIANTAHAVGLGCGAAWGFASGTWSKKKRWELK